MKTKKISLLFIVALLSFSGCEEGELDLTDPNVIVPDTFFQDEQQLQSAINAAYAPLQTQGMYGRIGFFLFDNSSQENQATDALQGGLATFLAFSYDPSTGEIFQFWRSAYRGLGAANFAIQSIEDGLVQNVSEEVVNQRLGEARFLRAFYFFNLVNLFGGVPLLLEPPTDGQGLPRSTVDEVYQVIFDDLSFAVANLPAKGATQNGRATRGAAQALKGKAHLFRGEWAQAKAEFDAITGYTIEGVAPRDNGNEAGEFNEESIFEVVFDKQFQGSAWNADAVAGRNIQEVTFRGIEYAPTNFANVTIAPDFFAEFEDDDPRIEAYFYQDGDLYNNGELVMERIQGIGVAWRKYQNLDVQPFDGFDFSGINFRVIRYADVLLMLAEAENELGNQAAAIDLLNRVRDRVGMPNYGTPEMDSRGYPVGSQQEVFEAIVHERAVELAGEQTRFLDLKRWGLASSILEGFETGKHELMPIPQQEIDANPQLSNADQNPGY